MEESHSKRESENLDVQLPPMKRPALQSQQSISVRDQSIDHHTTILTAPKMFLRHFQPTLVKYINLSALLPYLNKQQLLTDLENEVLCNLLIPHRSRVQKLLQFMEAKGERGFRLFLEAISEEPEHLGHQDLTEMFNSYREPASVFPASSKSVVTVNTHPLHRHQPQLVQCIDLDSLIPFLNQRQLLTDEEYDVLMNHHLSHRQRVLQLLQFVENKGEEGVLRFLEAISEEPGHLGHKELSEILKPYRLELSEKHKSPPAMRSVVNCTLLHTGLQPVHGVEYDLQQSITTREPPASPELGSQACKMVEVQSSTYNNSVSGIQSSVVYEEHMSASFRCHENVSAKNERANPTKSMPTSQEAASEDPSCEEELDEVKKFLESKHFEEPSKRIIQKYPNLTFPSGPLKRRSNSLIYNSLFQMAWGGKEDTARTVMKYLRRHGDVSVDIKIVSMEVVHTVNADRDLKILTSALAYTDRPSCENKTILKCRLHRRIAGLHYRNNDLEEANEHMDTAIQLAHNIAPDIDTIYTNRLKALMLFEDYKKTRCKQSYRDANKFFTRAMDHARQQPESKRIITERVKVSKALFHLDMRRECAKEKKGEDILEELEYRAQDTLEDVDEEYLTDGDRAFYYLTRAKLFVCNCDWQSAQSEAEKALDLNRKCGLPDRAKQAEALLENLPTGSSSNS